MNRILLVLSSMPHLAPGGCASRNSTQTSVGEIDSAREAAVDVAARSSGALVHWLSLPQDKSDR